MRDSSGDFSFPPECFSSDGLFSLMPSIINGVGAYANLLFNAGLRVNKCREMIYGLPARVISFRDRFPSGFPICRRFLRFDIVSLFFGAWPREKSNLCKIQRSFVANEWIIQHVIDCAEQTKLINTKSQIFTPKGLQMSSPRKSVGTKL